MTQPEALRLADELEKDRWHITGVTAQEASEELRRLHDLLGKANALCRIRLDRIEKLEAELLKVHKAIAKAEEA
jgi:ATP phosphoribosyltransferase regulatory subunit HisZ